jgi:PPOX class probable F420-dependent enzyme
MYAMVLSDSVRQALTSGHLAHLVTLNQDGSPQVTIVWIGLDGDEIVCAHLLNHQKLKNIRRDPRVALSIETGGKTGGLDDYLVINGRARITEGGAPALLNQLGQIYIGPGTTFLPDTSPPGYITHITVDSLHGVGPWGEEH